jgi:hypothetical protein
LISCKAKRLCREQAAASLDGPDVRQVDQQAQELQALLTRDVGKIEPPISS